MAMKWCLLFLFAICTADTIEKTKEGFKPHCEVFTDLTNCPTTKLPVCGTNGKTYENLCSLCTELTRTNEKILVAKRGEC